jgi:hypothetical protein
MFLPDLTPLTNKIEQFTVSQEQSQQQIIALLKAISLELQQINNKLNENA